MGIKHANSRKPSFTPSAPAQNHRLRAEIRAVHGGPRTDRNVCNGCPVCDPNRIATARSTPLEVLLEAACPLFAQDTELCGKIGFRAGSPRHFSSENGRFA
jgi:hypothetical protein